MAPLSRIPYITPLHTDLKIPIVDQADPNVTWCWMGFGKNKAKAIVKWIEEIKKFAGE